MTLTRLFFFHATATTEIYTLSLHDALPICHRQAAGAGSDRCSRGTRPLAPGSRQCARAGRSEEHTSELQSLRHLVCRLLLEKKKPLLFMMADAILDLVSACLMLTAVSVLVT